MPRRAKSCGIGNTGPVDIVWFVGFAAVMAGLWWFAYRMDPHYSSKDGTRFLCNGQDLIDGQPFGRKRETRVMVEHDGVLVISQKKLVRRTKARWALVAKSPEPPKGKAVYVARQFDNGKWLDDTMTLTMPAKSRVVGVLDEVLQRRATATN